MCARVMVCRYLGGCLCVCMCPCTRLCARVTVCGYLGAHLCVCMFMCTCLCAHELVCVLVHSCVCTLVHVHAWAATWDALCVHIRTQGRALNIRSLGAPLLTPRKHPVRQQGQHRCTPWHKSGGLAEMPARLCHRSWLLGKGQGGWRGCRCPAGAAGPPGCTPLSHTCPPSAEQCPVPTRALSPPP